MNEAQSHQEPQALDYVLELARKARLIVGGGLLVGVLAVAASYLVKPTFTSATVVLPPAQQQSLSGQALSSLGALASLAGGVAGGRSSIDQFVALLGSATVADRMIERFKLKKVYDEDLQMDARKQFWKGLRVSAGRRDGLITIEVDDEDPERARQMAAAMVEEFRRVTSEIAVTEAQQRRRFFEARVDETRKKLETAEKALQAVGFAAGTLKAEPKAAAESYAKLRAELSAAQVRLSALQSTFAGRAPEVQQQAAVVAGLAQQLRVAESQAPADQQGEYLSRYRDFKYQETLFELFLRQYELARVDEGREGGLLQVVDAAQKPEKKSKPRRAVIGLGASVLTALLLLVGVLVSFQVRRDDPSGRMHAKLKALLPSLLGRS